MRTVAVTEKSLVVQHNKIIEAKYKLSVSEQRLIKFLVSLIERNDEDFKPYKVAVADLANLLELKRKDYYKTIKEITRGLIGKVLVFKFSGRTIQASWLASADYYDGEGFVILQFAPVLKPFLLQLKGHFTPYEIGNIIRLKHTYSIRIYELLKQYESIGKRRFLVEELREILMLEESEYKQFCDFRRWVLKTAQKELEEKTDISFSWTEQKKVNKCVAIEFTINPKNRKQNRIKETILPIVENHVITDEKPGNPVIAQLVSLGVARKVAGELAGEYNEGRILAGIAYTLAQQKEGKVKSAAGFVVEAIKNEYRDNKAEERQRKEEAAKAEAAEKARLKTWEKVKDQWGAWKKEQAKAHIAAMDTETMEREKAAWWASLAENHALVNMIRNNAERENLYFFMYMVGKIDGCGLVDWARAVGVDLSPFEELARKEGRL